MITSPKCKYCQSENVRRTLLGSYKFLGGAALALGLMRLLYGHVFFAGAVLSLVGAAALFYPTYVCGDCKKSFY